MTVTTRETDEILVVLVTGPMTRRGGINGLDIAVTGAIQAGDKKILLDLAPTSWDAFGFDVLGAALKRIGENQKMVVCRVGEIGIKDVRWMRVLYSQADCYDTLEQAIAALKKDC